MGRKVDSKGRFRQTLQALDIRPGGHFHYHKDTPEENLSQTFLVALFSHTKPLNVFELSDNETSVFWEETNIGLN